MIGAIGPFLQGGGRALGALAPRLLSYASRFGSKSRIPSSTQMIFDQIPRIEEMPQYLQVPDYVQLPEPYNLGSMMRGNLTPADPDFWIPNRDNLTIPEMEPSPPESPFNYLDFVNSMRDQKIKEEVSEPDVVAPKAPAVPDRGTIGERVTDKIFDFLRGYGQSKSYGEGLARGVQAMTEGAQQRESAYRQKQAYMEQGFTEAQAEAMIRDPKYRDKMIEQQTKMQSLEGGRLGKDMEWVRDDNGKIVGQRVIKGSPTYMKRVDDYKKSQEGVQIVSVFAERFLHALDEAQSRLTGEDIKDGKAVGISRHLPTTGRIAQVMALISPSGHHGQIAHALSAVKNDQILNELTSLRQMAKSGASGLGQTTHKELEILGGVYGPIGIEYNDKQMLEAIQRMRESIKRVLQAQSDYAASLHPDRLYKPDEQLPEPFSAEKFLLDLLKNKQGSSEQSNLGLPVMSFEDAAKNVEVGGEFVGPDGTRYIKRRKGERGGIG